MDKRRVFTPEQKLTIVLEVLKEDRTLNEIAAGYEIHLAQVSRWKKGFLNNAPEIFNKKNWRGSEGQAGARKGKGRIFKANRATFLWKRLVKKNLVESNSREDRMKMIEKDN